MPTVTLVLGGTRSGKSRHALTLAEGRAQPAFVATAEATDQEMAERVLRHQRDRGDHFLTVEEPVRLASVLRGLPPATDMALVDCLTVWLGNLLHYFGDEDPRIETEVAGLLAVLEEPPLDIVLVANEVGMGIVPESALGRRFRDLAGRLNQEVAARADTVVFVVSGIPLRIKGDCA